MSRRCPNRDAPRVAVTLHPALLQGVGQLSQGPTEDVFV